MFEGIQTTFSYKAIKMFNINLRMIEVVWKPNKYCIISISL